MRVCRARSISSRGPRDCSGPYRSEQVQDAAFEARLRREMIPAAHHYSFDVATVFLLSWGSGVAPSNRAPERGVHCIEPVSADPTTRPTTRPTDEGVCHSVPPAFLSPERPTRASNA